VKSAILLLLATFIVSSPVLGDETWNCTFKIMEGDAKGFDGIAKIQVVGDTLNWQPDPGRGATFPYPVLQNNEVGIVAVVSQARMWKPMGQQDNHMVPLIGANAITLDKSSGDLRMGSIASNGVHNLNEGHCQRIPGTNVPSLAH
jgi:hypothetical protein